MNLPGLDTYRRSAFASIPGWMHALDLDLFDRILGQQLSTGATGDMLEIGSFHGKSAIVLGYGLRADESLTVCDIFGDTSDVPLEGTDPYDGLTVDDFRDKYAKWHDRAPDIRAMPSSELELDRDYRFIHIDGGHAYEVVHDDIVLCAEHATPGGVIVLDDYRTSHTPGTSAAAWEAVANGTLFPFLLSEAKLYAATNPFDQQQWIDVAGAFDLPLEQHMIRGAHVVRVWN